MRESTFYDVIIVGAGHNGLIAACYLALAGRRVLVLEKNERLGGATCSERVFAGQDARLSVYSYLISLLPDQILADLGIAFQVRRRAIASYTPAAGGGLLISNESQAVTRESFMALTGDEREYRRYQQLEAMLTLFAEKVWPTLMQPLPSREALLARFTTRAEREVWEYMVEKPLAHLIEDQLTDDRVRGVVFTDAKIGVSTYPHDPSLLQNRTFLYHVIGQGTGEWRVPVGGMGALVDALTVRGQALGVTFSTRAEVMRVEPGQPNCTVHFAQDGQPRALDARYVLFNTSSDILNRCLPGAYDEQQVEGSVFKINMLLKKLPVMKDGRISAREAFSGTFHINEGYENLKAAYHNARAGQRMEWQPGEMYCHSLTDPSILSAELQAQGYQTLTLFGLDVPYAWFAADNKGCKAALVANYLRSINQVLAEDFAGCLATDANGQPCIEAKSPLDLERSLGLPRGNIFHGNLTWPFAEREEEIGTLGVETRYANVLVCGSSAKRGGAVSGIPGYHAAMKVLGL